jgi:hypothetical protein
MFDFGPSFPFLGRRRRIVRVHAPFHEELGPTDPGLDVRGRTRQEISWRKPFMPTSSLYSMIVRSLGPGLLPVEVMTVYNGDVSAAGGETISLYTESVMVA